MQQEQQQQQQQQQQPQVIIIQQPVLIDNRTNRGSAPFIKRGVKFENGCWCPGCLFIILGIIGFIFIYIGIMLLSITEFAYASGILLVICGGVMVTSCCCLCHVARRDFNALPPDHPDRAKYSNNPILPQPTTTTYQLPPGGQIIGYPPALSGGQVVGYPPALPGGQVVGYSPALSGGQVVGYPPSPARQTESFAPSAPIAAVGHRTGDLPPSYEDVTKNSQNK